MEEEIRQRISLLRRELEAASEMESMLNEPTQYNPDGNSRELLQAMLFETAGRSTTRRKKVATTVKKNFVKDNRNKYKRRPSWNGGNNNNELDEENTEKVYQHLRSSIEEEKAKLRRRAKERLQSQQLQTAEKPMKKKKRNKQVILPKLQEKILLRVRKEDQKWDKHYSRQIDNMRRSYTYDSFSSSKEEHGALIQIEKSKREVKRGMFAVYKQVPTLFVQPVLKYYKKTQLLGAFGIWKSKIDEVITLENRFQGQLKLIRNLQARVRGKRERQRVQEMIRVRTEQVRALRLKSCTIIQSAWRTYIAMKQMRELVTVKMAKLKRIGTIECQRMFRGHRARRQQWGVLREKIWEIAHVWFGTVPLNRALGFLEKSGDNSGGKLSCLDKRQRKVLSRTVQCMIDSKSKHPKLSPQVFPRLVQCLGFMQVIQAQWKERLVSTTEQLEAERAKMQQVKEQENQEREKERWLHLKRREKEDDERKFIEQMMREEKELMLSEQRKLEFQQEEKKRALEVSAREKTQAERHIRDQLQQLRERQTGRVEDLQRRQKQELRDTKARYNVEAMELEAEKLPQTLLSISFKYSKLRSKLRLEKGEIEKEREKLLLDVKELSRTERLKVASFKDKLKELDTEYRVRKREFERQERDASETKKEYLQNKEAIQKRLEDIVTSIGDSRKKLKQVLSEKDCRLKEIAEEVDALLPQEIGEKKTSEEKWREDIVAVEQEGLKTVEIIQQTHEEEMKQLHKRHRKQIKKFHRKNNLSY